MNTTRSRKLTPCALVFFALAISAGACSDDSSGPGRDAAPAPDGVVTDAGLEDVGVAKCPRGGDPVGKLGYSAAYNLHQQSALCPCDRPKDGSSCPQLGLQCGYVQTYCPTNPMGPEYYFEHRIITCESSGWTYLKQDCFDCCRFGDMGVADAGTSG